MATKSQLIVKAQELGIALLGSETVAQLNTLIEQAQAQGDNPLMQEDTTEGEPKETVRTAPTVAFDINKLNPEQLKQLKAALEVTPSIANTGRKTISVRYFNDKYVIGIKNAVSKVALDPIEQRAITKITIPVLYFGADDFVVEDYKEFMQSTRVACEVMSEREVKGRIVEGVVFSQELKKEVEQIVNTVVRFYEVKLPNGEVIELFEDAVNL